MLLLGFAPLDHASADTSGPTTEEEEAGDVMDPNSATLPRVRANTLDVAAAGSGFPPRAFPTPVEPYGSAANWECTYPEERPGTRDTAELIRTSFDADYYSGLTRGCDVAWGAEKSYHKMGLAIDLPFDTADPASRAKGQALVDALLAPDERGNPHAMLRRLGIVRIIWSTGTGDDRVWNAEVSSDHMIGPDLSTWRELPGTSHQNHLHLTLSLRGGERATTYWTNDGWARFVDPNRDGAGSVIADHIFGQGWTNITDVDLDGDGLDELFYYNGETGFARFVSPDALGAGALIADYRFRRGWTNITDVDLDGDGSDELFYYNASTGLARFVDPNGLGAGALIADYGFRRGWTNITDVDLDGDGSDELFYYNAGTGLARFVDPNGLGAGALIADYGFRRGWTNITDVDLDGDGSDELFYYNAGTGLARFVDPNGLGAGALIADYGFRRGWTNITEVDLNGDGEDELFYYD